MIAGLALVGALLAPAPAPHLELGVGGGLGAVADRSTWMVRPWFGWRTEDFAISLQAPLRLHFKDSLIRDRDWDEPADFGRVLRLVRYKESVRAGTVSGVTFGHGTIVRRYNNGIDDDHHRVGLYVRLDPQVTGWPVGAQILVDQFLSAPVLAARSWASLVHGHVEAGATLAADTGAPSSLDGTVDDTGRPQGETQLLTALGFDGAWIPFLRRSWAIRMQGDLNIVDANPGVHLGSELSVQLDRDWRFALLVEAMYVEAGYDWAIFDTGWLVDRWRWPTRPDRTSDATWGGRARFSVDLRGALRTGVEIADAGLQNRSDLSAWLTLPTDVFQVRAFWRHRGGDERGDLLDPSEAMMAAAASVPLNDLLWVGAWAARMWRVPEGEARYRPFTEFMVTLEAATTR